MAMIAGYYISKTLSRGVSWSLNPTGKIFLALGMKKSWTTVA
jgi:hypothetical protein